MHVYLYSKDILSFAFLRSSEETGRLCKLKNAANFTLALQLVDAINLL